MNQIIVIGEPLVELSPLGAGSVEAGYRAGLGGDTYNTAVYLARLLGPGRVRYVTRLGHDALSTSIIQALESEHIDVSVIDRSASTAPGLSMIRNAANGERSFVYWRDTSPARSLLSGPAAKREIAALEAAGVIYLTAVTLAILQPEARDTLLSILAEKGASATGQVIFDTNYRHALWTDASRARHEIQRAMRAAFLVLPSLDDLEAVFGVSGADDCLRAIRDDAREVVLKTGGGPVLHYQHGCLERHAIQACPNPIDTTGAGDSFNAGFIAARLAGWSDSDGIQFGHQLASRVVMTRGAILDRADMTPFVKSNPQADTKTDSAGQAGNLNSA